MPDSKGVLSDDERDRAVGWLKGQLQSLQCPMCQHDELSMGKQTVRLGYLWEGDVTVFPCVPIMCKKCGFMSLHNTVFMGIEERA